MRYASGSVNLTAAGTAQRVLNTTDRVLWIRFSARFGNTGGMYVGKSDVSATNGRELRVPETANGYGDLAQCEYRPADFGGVLVMNIFYIDGDTTNNDIDYEAFFEDGVD